MVIARTPPWRGDEAISRIGIASADDHRLRNDRMEDMEQQIEAIIREAGAILMSHFRKTTSGVDKRWRGDVESDADHASEQCIVRGLNAAFPDDTILTEEHPNVGEPKNGRLWIVDSLDGSRNFLRGIPFFGIAIALIEHDHVQFGMVYLPVLDELFSATRGDGAFLNGKAIHVSDDPSLENAMIAPVHVYQRSDMQYVHAIEARLAEHGTWQMNLGTLVMVLCYIACGRFDGAVFGGMWGYDIIASCLIIEEAGGKITHNDGSPWRWKTDPQSVIAANPALHEKMMKKIIQP